MKGQSQFKQLLTEFVGIMDNWKKNSNLETIIKLEKLNKLAIKVKKCLSAE